VKWEDDHVYANHHREPWDDKLCEEILVHCRLDQLNGNYSEYDSASREKIKGLYARAKFQFDLEAAFDLVEEVIDPSVVDELAELVVKFNNPIILSFPHPAFDDEHAVGYSEESKYVPTNGLPFSYAGYLAEVLRCGKSSDIVQSARVGRTKLTRWLRFLCQPHFTGEVAQDSAYILLDDVAATAGTIAALRSYIVGNGGTVVGATCLAHKDGKKQKFAVAPETIDMLLSLYGSELESFWARKIGHEIHCVTEIEGKFLVWWATEREKHDGWSRGDQLLLGLGDKLDQAAATGRE
jgi:hypothetical protein